MSDLLLSLFFVVYAQWVDPRLPQLTGEAQAALAAKNYSLAEEKCIAALALDPYSVELQYNLALALSYQGKNAEAIKAYRAVIERASSGETKFSASFNLGELLAREKKIDEALAAYQEALEYKNDSKETKTNIELLIGQGGSQDQNKNENKDPKEEDDNKAKQYQSNKKPEPQKFKSENLTPADVNRILEELKNQEKRIRADYNRRQVKEAPHGKDW